ncbi:MAG TPA: hypothetical protein VF814_09410 [Casimicrobiaceae bacterium]
MPKGAALALSIACVVGAAAFVVAGLPWIAIPLFIVGVVFDGLFVVALRAEKRPSP